MPAANVRWMVWCPFLTSASNPAVCASMCVSGCGRRVTAQWMKTGWGSARHSRLIYMYTHPVVMVKPWQDACGVQDWDAYVNDMCLQDEVNTDTELPNALHMMTVHYGLVHRHGETRRHCWLWQQYLRQLFNFTETMLSNNSYSTCEQLP